MSIEKYNPEKHGLYNPTYRNKIVHESIKNNYKNQIVVIDEFHSISKAFKGLSKKKRIRNKQMKKLGLDKTSDLVKLLRNKESGFTSLHFNFLGDE